MGLWYRRIGAPSAPTGDSGGQPGLPPATGDANMAKGASGITGPALPPRNKRDPIRFPGSWGIHNIGNSCFFNQFVVFMRKSGLADRLLQYSPGTDQLMFDGGGRFEYDPNKVLDREFRQKSFPHWQRALHYKRAPEDNELAPDPKGEAVGNIMKCWNEYLRKEEVKGIITHVEWVQKRFPEKAPRDMNQMMELLSIFLPEGALPIADMAKERFVYRHAADGAGTFVQGVVQDTQPPASWIEERVTDNEIGTTVWEARIYDQASIWDRHTDYYLRRWRSNPNVGVYFQRVHERYISEDHTIREKDDTPVQVNYLKADYIGIHGGTATGGHYWGYIREGDRWYEVNDSCVFEANVSEIVARAKDIVCVFPHSAVLQAPEAELLESVKLRYIADQADIAAQNVAVDAQEQATAIQIQKLSRGILTRARLQRAKAAANAGEAKRRGGQGEDSESESEKEDAV